MAHDVFISYADEDKVTANAVCAKLEGRRARCWIAPRDIEPGVNWPAAIVEAIAASKVMVLVYSGFAGASDQVMREVQLAADHGVIIVPFRIEDAPLPEFFQFHMSNRHWLDALTPPLEHHLDRLSSTISKLLPSAEDDSQEAPPVAPQTPKAERPALVRQFDRRYLWALPATAFAAMAAIVALVLLLSSGGASQLSSTGTPAASQVAANPTGNQGFTPTEPPGDQGSASAVPSLSALQAIVGAGCPVAWLANSDGVLKATVDNVPLGESDLPIIAAVNCGNAASILAGVQKSKNLLLGAFTDDFVSSLDCPPSYSDLESAILESAPSWVSDHTVEVRTREVWDHQSLEEVYRVSDETGRWVIYSNNQSNGATNWPCD